MNLVKLLYQMYVDMYLKKHVFEILKFLLCKSDFTLLVTSSMVSQHRVL